MKESKHYISGKEKLKSRDYQGALKDFNMALSEDPENAYYLFDRGVTYFHLKQFDKAIYDMDRAVELQPGNPYRYSGRAYIKGAVGDVSGGIEDYKKAIELDPEDAIAHNNLGLLQEKLGYLKDSKSNFKKADMLAADDDFFKKLTHQNNNGSNGHAKVRDTSQTPKLSFTGKASPTLEMSYWEIITGIFKSRSMFYEFISFVKSGFRIKENDR